LPPDTLAEAEAIKTLKVTLADPPQLEPSRHDEKATPVAAAHEMVLPTFEPTCQNKDVTLESVPVSKAAKLLIPTEQRCC
jgi:hypothetical protein